MGKGDGKKNRPLFDENKFPPFQLVTETRFGF
jgi:hypothetical protein